MTWKYLRDYLSKNKISYQEYLLSDHWKDVRSRFWKSKLHKGCCYACRSKEDLQVHHKSYKRIGKEKLHDLCLLCDRCHKLTHIIDNTRKNGCLWGAPKRLRKNIKK